MWPLKTIISEKEPCFEGFNTYLWVSKEIDGKTFIFRVYLGMWPLKLIISEKWALFWGFHFQLSSPCNWLSSQVFPVYNILSCFQLSSLCNWPSSGVCPVYNIPSVGVKGTSAVLWSSANFCSISQNIHYKAPVAAQHWKTNKVVWTWKDDWPPRRNSTYERPFTQEGNYLVINMFLIVITLKLEHRMFMNTASFIFQSLFMKLL